LADPPSDDFGDTDNEHKRATRRQRVLKQGFAQENPQTSAIACVIRDLSETGARLKFEAMAIIPERFILHIPVDGIQIDCVRRWIRGQECGVAFTSGRSPTALAKHQVVTPIGPAADGGDQTVGDRATPASSTDAPREPTPHRPGPRRPGFGRR